MGPWGETHRSLVTPRTSATMSVAISVWTVVMNEGEILLINSETEGGQRYLPGGLVKPEERLREAARRTLMERAGLSATPSRLLLVVERSNEEGGGVDPSRREGLDFYFLASPTLDVAEMAEQSTRPLRPGTEWVSLEEVGQLSSLGDQLRKVITGQGSDTLVDRP